MIRTYKIKHEINQTKKGKVLSILNSYRRTCAIMAILQWRLFFETGSLNKMEKIKDVRSNLSERYKRNCLYQVEAALRSFISNRQNDFVKMVYNSSISEDVRKSLFKINRRKLWFKTESDAVSPEELFLARKIFKHILSKHRKPSFHYANMLLNSNVAEIIVADKNKASEFDYWVKLATLEKGKPIMLPLKTNKYFESIDGEIKQAIQLNVNDNRELTISLMKDVRPKKYFPKVNKISLDIGLKNLFALNSGDLLGRGFYHKLEKYDGLIKELASNRQRQNLKTKSRRYRLLVNKLRNLIKNEVRRNLNRIIYLYAPKEIVIERLDFRNQNLSRWMNRLLSNFGKGQIIDKLESLKEEYGIEYKEINPAYTSQECPCCHYVAKSNRKSRDKFKCGYCGYSKHADVVGARIAFDRSSDKEILNIYLSRKVILQKLVTRFLERNPRHYSMANGLLWNNPYFRDYVTQPKLVA